MAGCWRKPVRRRSILGSAQTVVAVSSHLSRAPFLIPPPPIPPSTRQVKQTVPPNARPARRAAVGAAAAAPPMDSDPTGASAWIRTAAACAPKRSSHRPIWLFTWPPTAKRGSFNVASATSISISPPTWWPTRKSIVETGRSSAPTVGRLLAGLHT